MANEKIFQSRIQLKHDIEENWSKATNFIPKVGEIIIYDIDENNSIARFKIGDGITNINSLPFVSHHEVISYLPQELTEEQKKQARDNIGSGDPQVQADWDQSDETAVDFIKNRTHYEEVVTDDIDITGLEYDILFEHNGTTLVLTEHNKNIPFALGQVWSCNVGSRISELTVKEADDGTLYASSGSGGYPSPSTYYITPNTAAIAPSFGNNFGTSAVLTGVSGTYVATETQVHRLDEKYLPENIQADWSQSDSTKLDYVKNRTHYDDVIYSLKDRDELFYIIDEFIGGISGDHYLIDGLTFRVVADGVVYDDVPVYNGCYIAGGTTYGIGDAYTNGAFKTTNYGFCVSGYSVITNQDIFPEGIKTIEVYTVERNLKQLDPKFIKDMYYEGEVTVFEEQTISGFAVMNDPIYAVEMENILSPEEGKECTVEWDGVAYDVVWETHPDMQVIYAGNENYVNMTSGGDIPFAIVTSPTENLMFFVTESTAESHTVCVKELGIHYIDPKYIKDMYYDGTKKVDISGATYTISGVTLSNLTVTHEPIPLELGQVWQMRQMHYSGSWTDAVEEIVKQDEDGTLYIGSLEGNYVTETELTLMSGTVQQGFDTVEITCISGYATQREIKQLDEKYLSILEETYETVFEADSFANSSFVEIPSFERLIGKHRVTIDGVSEICEFIDVPENGGSCYNGSTFFVITDDAGVLFEFSDGESHSVRIEKIQNVVKSEYLPDEAKAQADWEQNDETAADYIKNRTHYEYEKLTPLKDPLTVACNSAFTYGGIECYANTGAYAYWVGGWPSLVGQIIKIIFDGKPYDVPISKDREMSSLTSYPFAICETTDRFYVYALESGTHTLEFYSIDDYELKQLDEKFIPDTIARTDNFINGIKLTDTVTGLKYLVQIQDGTLVTMLSIEDLLIDFDYTTNEDGTYTLTNWKQTLNGEESTELIIPEYPKIIL